MEALRAQILGLIADGKPLAFMSYSQKDDAGDSGYLTRFCEFLSKEIEQLSGIPFPIFQDTKDIQWGQLVKKSFTRSAKKVVFLIPVVTPLYFGSRSCKRELAQFLELERGLGRQDLLLPVYYIECAEMEDEARRCHNQTATVLYQRKWLDWRDYRNKPCTGKVKRILSHSAKTVAKRLKAMLEPEEALGRTPRSRSRKTVPHSATGTRPAARSRVGPTAYVVDAMTPGEFATLSEAVKHAPPGSTIKVHPGTYRAPLTVDKPLHIIGQTDGHGGKAILRSEGPDALRFTASTGYIANLTIAQMSEGDGSAVRIVKGHLTLENCDMSSKGRRCVVVSRTASADLRKNQVHDCAGSGILIRSIGNATLQDNAISRTAGPGVVVARDGNPTLRGNRISDCEDWGILIDDGGRGVLENNHVCNNHGGGVLIKGGARATVRRNEITHNQGDGMRVCRGGQATLEGNELEDNPMTDLNAPVPAYGHLRGQTDDWTVKVLAVLFSPKRIFRRWRSKAD